MGVIPNPMLAKPAAMPTRGGYAYEPKMDGFRCLVSTEQAFRAISRRRWNMTALLPELEPFPASGVFDGELIGFTDGQPDFVALCDRMLLRKDLTVPVAFVVFDVLSIEGTPTIGDPYWKRRAILESLSLGGPAWSLLPSFEDGSALWQVVEAQELEGVVAKPLGGVYKPGERGWLKVKNRCYWKYEIEREAVTSRNVRPGRERSFVATI